MAKTATAAPVLPGQDARSVAEMLRSRMDEYRESRARAGITMERAYLMQTPMGAFVTVYVEADGDANAATQKIVQSDLPIDRDFVAALGRVHGISFDAPPAEGPPEVVGDWEDPEVSTRKAGLAFMAPLIPGQTDAGRAFTKVAFVDRVAELTESRRALGNCRETVVLNHTPMGDVICVYLEGDDPVEGNRRHSASTTPYDTWFRQQLLTIFPPEIRFDQPLPPIEQIWDWHRATAAV